MSVLNKVIIASSLVLAASAAYALPIPVKTYAMLNGATGTYQYWDESYVGTSPASNSTTTNAPLQGGTGDLTDGVIATQNWNIVEAPAGPGPYVGWLNFNPTITFAFDGPQNFFSLTLWLDDSDGFGDVSAPSAVSVKVGSDPVEVFTVAEPLGTDPFAFVIPLAGKSGDTVTVTLSAKNAWVFLSEAVFEDGRDGPDPVPAPASLALLGIGLAALAAARHRKG